MRTVQGVYDGQVVRLLEPIEVENTCRVTVTFVELLEKDQLAADQDGLERFVGMWTDLTPEEELVFQTVLEERASYFTGRDFEAGKETES